MGDDKRGEVILPPLYYLDHFEYLLARVKVQYGFLLEDTERELLATFAALPLPARALWVRLSLRRPLFFRVQRLHYPEIADLPAALERLLAAGLAQPLSPAHGGELEGLLAPFTKGELLAAAAALDSPLPRTIPRPRLVAALLERPPEPLIATLAAREPVIRRCHDDTLEWLLFLFFGRLDQGLEDFILRDLGRRRFESPADDELTPRFTDRREARDSYRAARLYTAFRELRERHHPLTLWHWLRERLDRHPELHPSAQPILEKLHLSLGRRLERTHCWEAALAVYGATARPPARERRVRLLHKLGRRGEALALCRTLAGSDLAEERVFAEEFTARLGGERGGRRRQLLRAAETLDLEACHRHRVEQGVLEQLTGQGWQGVHSENHLWRGLFGLLLWDIVFDPALGGLHQPLQRAPQDLFGPEFLPPRREAIATRLAELEHPEIVRTRIEATFAAKAGIINPLVPWLDDLPGWIVRLLDGLTPAQLRGVLWAMAHDPRERGRGFPDLFLWRGRACRFVEVKAPGDTLSPYQWQWLQRFRELDIEARVLAVRWRSAKEDHRPLPDSPHDR